MTFTVLSLFPSIVEAFFANSIMAKAVEKGFLRYKAINIRDWAIDKHHKCDDAPYGGGAGMLMLPEPLGACLQAQGVFPKDVGAAAPNSMRDTTKRRVVYLSPSGKLLTQAKAEELAGLEELVLIAGRYEGIDERIVERYVDEEISIGDYVLSSGEVAALVVIDAVYRLIDGIISGESLEEESFSGPWLEYPQYTRPEIYANLRVPEVLLSGHHENIRKWRLEKRIQKTLTNRPDLLKKALESGLLSKEEITILTDLYTPIAGDKGERDAGNQGDRSYSDED